MTVNPKQDNQMVACRYCRKGKTEFGDKCGDCNGKGYITKRRERIG